MTAGAEAGIINEQLEMVSYPAMAQAGSITIKAVPALRTLSTEWTSRPRH